MMALSVAMISDEDLNAVLEWILSQQPAEEPSQAAVESAEPGQAQITDPPPEALDTETETVQPEQILQTALNDSGKSVVNSAETPDSLLTPPPDRELLVPDAPGAEMLAASDGESEQKLVPDQPEAGTPEAGEAETIQSETIQSETSQAEETSAETPAPVIVDSARAGEERQEPAPEAVTGKEIPELVPVVQPAASAPAQTSKTVTAVTAAKHRPLRSNQQPSTRPAPTEPQSFHGYADAPAFTVLPRVASLTFYPCANCHQVMKPNPEPRKLVAAPHPAALDHGEGRMWFLDCHSVDDRNNLHTLDDQPVAFDESYLVCGQCHADRQKVWYFGAHGKRVSNWQGEREIYSCTDCHDPDSPSLKPREPSKAPPVRAGLSPMQHTLRDNRQLWERLSKIQLADEPADEVETD